MNINKIIILAIAIFASFFISGCKKDAANRTDPNSLIVGSWRLVQTGSDVNGNDKLDPGENNNLPANYIRTDTYNANKTGRSVVQLPTANSSTEDFTYTSIADNNLKLIISGSVKNYKIITLNNTSLVFYEVNTDPHQIFAFTKQ